MRQTLHWPLSAAVALGLLAAPMSINSAAAQPAPSDAGRPGQGADPPTRVGRLAKISGAVSFHAPDAEQWDAASINDPVATGTAFWTEPRSQAVAELPGARVVLGPSTELDVDTLDNSTLLATEPQGEACVLVRELLDGATIVVRTPRGAVTIRSPGRYGVFAGDTDNPTRVAVLAGAAELQGTGVDLQLTAGQTGIVPGGDAFQSAVAPVGHDAFLAAACQPPSTPSRPLVAPPPVVAGMTGAEDLAEYGSWQPSPDYGPVWFPHVRAGWMPYREGRWAYVAPWGWTWVDSAPWGFAPFHYGRWAKIHGRWGWMPASYAAEAAEPPVYAPALVSFVDPGPAFAAGLAVGAAGGAALAVGWLPLGPHEPYRPWYHASDGYIRNVNARQLRSVTNISAVSNTTVNNYVNRAAATAVPAAVMTASRPVAQAARPIPEATLAAAQTLIGRPPVQPTSQTAGLTRAMATSLQLSAPGQGVPARPPAPGPTLANRTVAGQPLALRAPASRVGLAATPPGEASGVPPRALPPLLPPGERARAPGQLGAPGPAIAPHDPGASLALRPPAAAGEAARGAAFPSAPHARVEPPPNGAAPAGAALAPTTPAGHPRPIVPPAAVIAPTPRTAVVVPLAPPPVHAQQPRPALPPAAFAPSAAPARAPSPVPQPAPPPAVAARTPPPAVARVAPPVVERPPQVVSPAPQVAAHAPPPVRPAPPPPPARAAPHPAARPGEKQPS